MEINDNTGWSIYFIDYNKKSNILSHNGRGEMQWNGFVRIKVSKGYMTAAEFYNKNMLKLKKV